MTILKYLVFLGAVYSAITHGPIVWKRFTLKRQITNSGIKLKTFGLADNCKTKKYCITVYVSPDSRQSEITFQAFYKFLPRLRPDVGFGVVIGGTNLRDMNDFRVQLRDIQTYVDETGLALEVHKIKSYPTWIVTDVQGDEVLRTTGAVSAVTLGQVNQILVDQLKL